MFFYAHMTYRYLKHTQVNTESVSGSALFFPAEYLWFLPGFSVSLCFVWVYQLSAQHDKSCPFSSRKRRFLRALLKTNMFSGGLLSRKPRWPRKSSVLTWFHSDPRHLLLRFRRTGAFLWNREQLRLLRPVKLGLNLFSYRVCFILLFLKTTVRSCCWHESYRNFRGHLSGGSL